MKKLPWSFGLLLFIAILGCASLPVSPPGTKPVITHALINQEGGTYGSVLRIYLEANDPQGFMFRIATAVDQVGYGSYPTDWIYLKPQYQHQLIGYLQWNTFSVHASWMPEWTQMTIKVSIIDTNGNESNMVVFPFEFVSEALPETPLSPPFHQGNVPLLGYIGIDLFNPLEMEDDRDRRESIFP
ncbi:MAG TPA: hypothetical protein VMV04_18960 [Thermodesulfobacteriota bacterium]|nr:hypothetical protein [Thermodesulfobacteriota bacterium]